jgi:hypothetical protein
VGTAVYNRVKFTEHDTGDILDVEYEGVDITGWTVYLHIGYPDCPLRKTAVLTDPTNGRLQFHFDYGDLRAGSYFAEIRFIDLSGKELTIGEITFDILHRVKG